MSNWLDDKSLDLLKQPPCLSVSLIFVTGSYKSRSMDSKNGTITPISYIFIMMLGSDHTGETETRCNPNWSLPLPEVIRHRPVLYELPQLKNCRAPQHRQGRCGRDLTANRQPLSKLLPQRRPLLLHLFGRQGFEITWSQASGDDAILSIAIHPLLRHVFETRLQHSNAHHTCTIRHDESWLAQRKSQFAKQ